jgi:hypothetical protein
VYAVKSGLPLPDDRSFAVLWMDRTAAEAAFTMEGAFNDVAVALAPGANAKAVIDDLDRLLEPYGTLGAIERRDQQSHRFLDDELSQQRIISITVPCVFLGLAVFLLNVALARLVVAQQEQIAALKALGFPTAPIVIHYLKSVAIVVLLGPGLGIAAGDGFGRAMDDLARPHEETIADRNGGDRHHVVAHERDDEGVVYPKLAKVLADHHGLSAMSRAHCEILHLSRLLAPIVEDLPFERIDRYLIRDAQRVIEAVEALVRIHTAQEKDIYDAVVER